jgi:hypothetical protein
MVPATIVSQTSNAGFVFHVRVTAHNHSSFLLNPRQKLIVIFIIFTTKVKFGQGGGFSFKTDVSLTFTRSKLTPATSGQTPQGTNSSMASRPSMYLEAQTKALSLKSSSGQLKEGFM